MLFAIDACDREVIGWLATSAGISGEMVRDLMVACVERRFRDQQGGASRRMVVRQRLGVHRQGHARHRNGLGPQALFHASPRRGILIGVHSRNHRRMPMPYRATLPVRVETECGPIRQSCTGVLTVENGFYKLEPDAGSVLGCDSFLSENLVQTVLRVCAVGGRCHIDGSVRGHGVCYWLNISSVTARKEIRR